MCRCVGQKYAIIRLYFLKRRMLRFLPSSSAPSDFLPLQTRRSVVRNAAVDPEKKIHKALRGTISPSAFICKSQKKKPVEDVQIPPMIGVRTLLSHCCLLTKRRLVLQCFQEKIGSVLSRRALFFSSGVFQNPVKRSLLQPALRMSWCVSFRSRQNMRRKR